MAEKDFASIALAYAVEAASESNKDRFCKWVRLAAQRHLKDLKRTEWEFEFSEWHASDVCQFIELLPHVKGQWDSKTITLEPPQIFWLACLFGWRRKESGGRRFNEAYIEVARKNAKSTIAAGIALYCLAYEDEPGPEIYVGATTGDQAQKVFDPARAMVRKLPAFQEAFGVEAWSRSITCKENGGFIRPINAKSSTQDGHNPHCVIMDELHAHKDRGLFDVMISAFGARKNPLILSITTAGFDTTGVCYDRRDVLCKTLDGILEMDHLFGVIYTLDEGDDPFDESAWIKANPLLGSACQLEDMRRAAADARASAADEGNFKTKRLNIWMNAAQAWLNSALWTACADPSLDWDAFEGLECYVGADLSDKDDITAVGLLGVTRDDQVLWKPVFYLPENVLERHGNAEGNRGAPYRKWRDQGFIRLVGEDFVDHRAVKSQIEEWVVRFDVRQVIFDQYAGAQIMAAELNEEWGEGFAVILPKRKTNTTDAAKDLEARHKAGVLRFRHDGNEVMNWMASNVVVSVGVDGSIVPKKEKPMSDRKIDGIDALVNALFPVATQSQREGQSVYESVDLMMV